MVKMPAKSIPMFRRAARYAGWLLAIVTVILVSALGGALFIRSKAQEANASMQRIVSPSGIDDARYVEIGGVRQWITVRGQDRSQPILLFLHGGPGDAMADLTYAFQRPWEEYFTVVQWDQRGFGRSAIDGDRLTGSITKEQVIADGIELAEYLQGRFGQRKIFIMGHSWGSVVGLEIAHRRPDLLHALVTTGQAVAWEQGFAERRVLFMEEARAKGDFQTVAAMERLGPPPASGEYGPLLDWILQIPIWETGHSLHNDDGSSIAFPMIALFSPSGRLSDLAGLMLPDAQYEANMAEIFGSLRGWTAEGSVGTELKVPWIVMQGDHDWQTPTHMAKTYYDRVCAPWKKWIAFRHSAHQVPLEEPGRALAALVGDVLPAKDGQLPADAEVCTGQR
jgi:pimeloyl-ACP methyl ester carboxylesterase